MDTPPDQPGFMVDGNRLTLLDSGPRRLDSLLALIDGATVSLRILYYIYADDETGRRVNAALAAAAQRGVRVALIVDGFGSEAADDSFFAPLETAGVSVCRFSARFGRRYLLRNHQKLALADADTQAARIIIGGFNIEDDYFGTPAQQAWRDLGLLVEGAAASRMAGYFDALEQGIRDGGQIRRLNRALARWSETDGNLRWLIGGPTRNLSPWARAIRADMRRATRIDLIAGYFTPSPSMLRGLNHAGRRNRGATGRVRVVTASKSDNNVTIAASRFTYAGLLRRGAEVYEYAATKLHTKLYVVDNATWIGSANFDMRSLFINLELMLRIEDASFAAHVRTYIDGEIARSTAITPERYRSMAGPWQRAKQFVAYLVTAVADPAISRGLNWGIDD
jgi:cardiolipin synthase